MAGKMAALGTVGGSAVAALTWENIPQTYESLEIQFSLMSAASSGEVALYLSYNNDVTESRWFPSGQRLSNSSWSAYSGAAGVAMWIGGILGQAAASTKQQTGGIIRIMNYSTAHRVSGEGLPNISAYSECFYGTNDSGASPVNGLWTLSHGHDTATGTPAAGTSINRLDLYIGTGANFTTTSSATLYGLP